MNQPPVNTLPEPADAPIGGEVLVNTHLPNSQTAPAAATLADGSYVIVWRSLDQDGSGLGIYSQRFHDSGAPAGPETRVNSTTFSGQDLPSVSALAGGGYVVAWTSVAAGEATYFQRYDAAGSPVGGETLAASVYNGRVAGLADGGFLIAWTTSGSAYAQRFDASGAVLGGPALLGPSANSNPVGQLSVAGLPGGGYVATWTSSNGPDDTDVYARQFDSSGQALGPEFLVSTAQGSINHLPDVAALADGGFAIAWRWVDFDEGAAIYARRFDSTGLQVGTQRLLDESSDVNGLAPPRLTGLGGGGFVVTWSAQVSGTPQVFAQRFDAAGVAEGSAVKINTAANGSGPDVTPVGLDSYVVAWSSFQTGQGNPPSGFDILTQRRGPVVQALEDADFVFSAAAGNAISVSDPDAASLTVTLSAARGALTLSGTSGLAFTLGDGTADSTMTFSGTAAAINAALNGLVYRGPPDGQGTDSITVSTTDDGNGDPGASLTDTDTLEIFLVDDHFIPGDSGPNSLDGTPLADLFSLEHGGEDTARGFGGNDIFYFGNALSAGDVADGGAGGDAIVLQGNVTALLSETNLVGIESISIQSGANTRFGDTANNFYDYDVTTANGNVPAGQQLIVNAQSLRAGEDFAFDGSAETDGKFLIYGGHGLDDLTGGAGVDVFFFEGSRWGEGDKVNGGGGRDAIVISAGSGLTRIEFASDSLTSIESISVNKQYATDPTQTPSYELVLHNGNVAAGATLIVNASSLANTSQTINIDGRAVQNGNLILFGGAGNDVITGGHGADLIVGGGLADALTGGAGADTFRYDSTSDSTAGAPDLIGDFTSGTDKIDLSRIDANTIAAGDQAFTWIGSNAFAGSGASSAGQLRVYQNNGYWYAEGDTNGDGNADLVITFQIGTAPPLQGDFLV
jgi:Ca2+-binding RTX toxin-like protein